MLRTAEKWRDWNLHSITTKGDDETLDRNRLYRINWTRFVVGWWCW